MFLASRLARLWNEISLNKKEKNTLDKNFAQSFFGGTGDLDQRCRNFRTLNIRIRTSLRHYAFYDSSTPPASSYNPARVVTTVVSFIIVVESFLLIYCCVKFLPLRTILVQRFLPCLPRSRDIRTPIVWNRLEPFTRRRSTRLFVS